MKIILYMHGGSKNHGCEAIVRTTVQLINNNQVNLLSNNPQEDFQYGIGEICNIIDARNEIKKFSYLHIYMKIFNDLLKKKEKVIKKVYSKTIQNVESGDLCFSIGGDNYCYESINDTLKVINEECNKKHAKTVLWGCSIEPELLENKSIVEDMKQYSLITARETITYQALLRAGVTQNVKVFPDPAFLLDTVKLELPHGFKEGDTIGINLSPMILEYEKTKGIAKSNFKALIQHIIDTTSSQIALIPHVLRNGSDDSLVLKELYQMFRTTGRVILIEDCNCMELKGYIGRCKVFIGARTHATIAAYSSFVPTLVVGYSVKAKGIAKDIFGGYENYVIPVQTLYNQNDLIEAFEWLCEHEVEIRNHLIEFMPKYCEKALEAGEEVKRLLGEQ